LSNGLGGTFSTWRHLVRHLLPRFQFISWDYRGLHGSEAPSDPSSIRVEDNTNDLEDLLAHLQIDKAIFLGWSMGVQVNFELMRRSPERFIALGVINGTAGRPVETMRGGLVARTLLPRALDGMAKHGREVGVFARALAGWQGFLPTAKRIGFLAPTLDEEVFAELAREFAELDFGLYCRMLAGLNDHDAWDVLPKIRVPTTLVVGDRDLMTPVVAATRMSQLIPDARLVVIPRCTHYTPVERPDLVNRAIENLIARAGFERAA
jgi:pimeloyl-ACP methyl ester carboxylesterase